MRQMADVKYALDDNIKQNFLEPLHHLQTKDLKEVMVNSNYKYCSITHTHTHTQHFRYFSMFSFNSKGMYYFILKILQK